MGYAQPAEPASGDRFDLKTNGAAWTGALLLIYPTKVNEAKQWNPAYEATESVSADITILDRYGDDGQPINLKDTMIFAQVINAQLKGNLRDAPGEPVLGRLLKVKTEKGHDAWKLGPFGAGDDQIADRWIAAHPRNAVQQPAGASAPPPSAPPAAAGGWSLPPAPAPAAPVAIPKDPNLVAYLLSKGVLQQQIDPMTPEAADLLARSFPA